MIFSQLDIENSKGAVLGYAIVYSNGVAKKGQIIDTGLINNLQNDGIRTVYAGRIGETDITENSAADQLSEIIAGHGTLFSSANTGRANIFSDKNGIALLSETGLIKFNHLDETLTIATCNPFKKVVVGERLATLKVIPFAVDQKIFEEAKSICEQKTPLIKFAPFQEKYLGLILTKNPWTKKSLIQKGEEIIENKLRELGSHLARTIVCSHDEKSIAKAISALHQNKLSPILILGSSAIADRSDAIPNGVRLAGGEVRHLGMPVEPGNLLMLAAHNKTPLIGIPTCARSPKLNGFDWVLERLLAGIDVTPLDIMNMGIGGLLL